MKATGIIRQVDTLGRVVLPKELRTVLNLEEGSPLEIYTEDNTIILKPYSPGCIFCGEVQNVQCVKGQHICQNCLKELKR
jgi:transcriptional pleiotropic regulator of transition state genes